MGKKSAAALLTQLVEALGQSEGAAGQLIHHFRNPGWMIIRDNLTRAKDLSVGLAVKGTLGGNNAGLH